MQIIQVNNYFDDYIYIDKKQLRRRRALLLTGGCQVKTCTMCSLPYEDNHSMIDLLNQVKNIIKLNDDIDFLTLYNNGNFFYDKEITEEDRIKIYQYLANTKIKYLLVESLPQFITDNKLNNAKKYLNKNLQVAIGLQTWDEKLRRKNIKTPCSNRSFEQSLILLKKYNYSASIFILYGIPYVDKDLSDVEITSTIDNLIDLDKNYDFSSIIICPLKPSEKSVLNFNIVNNNAHQTYLPTIEDVVYLCRNLKKLAINHKIYISTSLLNYKESMPSVNQQNRQNYITEINLFNKKS